MRRAASRRALAGLAVVAAALAGGACNPLAKMRESGDAGTPTSASGAASTSAETPPRGKTLDATECNPGTSLDPVDKGKSVTTDHFKYTLLDVREDTVDPPGGLLPPKKVFLVKLQVENVTQKADLNTSISEVGLSRDKADADRVKEKDLVYRTDFFYPRTKTCVDLGADVGKGKIPPGTKVVGYYVYDGATPYKSLWFSMRNISPESVGKGRLLEIVGSFRIK